VSSTAPIQARLRELRAKLELAPPRLRRGLEAAIRSCENRAATLAHKRLTAARELVLRRGTWCQPEPAQPNEWREVLSQDDARLLLERGLARVDGERLVPTGGDHERI